MAFISLNTNMGYCSISYWWINLLLTNTIQNNHVTVTLTHWPVSHTACVPCQMHLTLPPPQLLAWLVSFCQTTLTVSPLVLSWLRIGATVLVLSGEREVCPKACLCPRSKSSYMLQTECNSKQSSLTERVAVGSGFRNTQNFVKIFCSSDTAQKWLACIYVSLLCFFLHFTPTSVCFRWTRYDF